MGEYFDDEDYEDDDEEELDEKDDIEIKYDNMNQIVESRNKLNHEVKIIRKDLKEDLGRRRLKLFGDPRNVEYEGTKDRIERELSTPMTKAHPIAQHMRTAFTEIEELDMTQIKYTKFLEKQLIEIATLLDESIRIHRKTIGDVKEKIKKEMKEEEKVKEESYVTREMVSSFMARWGSKILDNYNDAVKREAYDACLKWRRQFTDRAQVYFANVHNSPKDFACKLLDRLSIAPWVEVRKLAKLKGKPKSYESEPEPIQTQQRPLKDNEIEDNEQKQEDLSDD